MKLLRLMSIVGSLTLLPVADARADETTLSLDEVVHTVLAKYPLLAAAQKEIDIADADLLSAKGGFDPAVRARGVSIPVGPYPSDRVETVVEQPTSLWGARVFGGWRYSRGEFAPYDGKLVTSDYGEVRAGLGVPLLRDGPIDRRRAAIRRAELGAALAPLTVEERKIEIVRLSSLRYWDWAAAGRRIRVAQDLLGVAVARDVQLKTRVERGDLPTIERADNERAIQQRTAQVAAAQRTLENAAIELSLFMRTDSGAPTIIDARRLPPVLPDPVVPETAKGASDEQIALTRRPEPRRFGLLGDQARVDRELAQNQKLLGVDVVVAGSKDLGPGDPKLAKPELELMVMVDVPLFNRVQEGRARAAEANVARASIQGEFARDRVVADVRDARSALELARQRVVAGRREVAVSKELVALEKQRFELGEGTLFLINLREQAAAEAELREIDALADFHKAVAGHRAATGFTNVR